MSRYVCSPVQNNNTYQREKKLGENYFETWLLEPKSNAVIVTWWVFDRPIQGAQAGALGVAVGMLVCQGTTILIGEWPKMNTDIAMLDLHVLSSTKRL